MSKSVMEPEIGDDLRITEVTSRGEVGGFWVIGSVHGHQFNALVFPDHAISPENELGTSKIAKLWIKQDCDNQVVYEFDRGVSIKAKTSIAGAIADFLAAGLADAVC